MSWFYCNIVMVINVDIHDSVNKYQCFWIDYLCWRRFSILSDQNKCTQMKIDFEWWKEDENKYAQIKNRQVWFLFVKVLIFLVYVLMW